eukprot:1920160-Prymnesium_polylepis.1
MAKCFFTRDSAFLDLPAHLTAMAPGKFAPAATQLVADGMPNDGTGDLKLQLVHLANTMATQNAAAMPAAFLVVIGDAVMVQPVGGGLRAGGLAATEYMRQNR